MMIKIALYINNAGIGDPQKEARFYEKTEEFYERVVEYAEALHIRNEVMDKIVKQTVKKN